MYGDFECLRNGITGVQLNTTAIVEHVMDIKRQIQSVRERVHAIRSNLPFNNLPNRVIIELMNCVVLWINVFPPSSGVSLTYIPSTIMTGTALDYIKYCKIPFGVYAETHEERNPKKRSTNEQEV
jgi:hypothetical protein